MLGPMDAPRAPRVFLSYASEDVNWVDQFKGFFVRPLGNVVVEDFMDGANLDFGPLGQWLDQQVDQASVMVAFVSEKYRDKEWTKAEWQAGLTNAQRGKLIFVPVMMHADGKAWWSSLRSKGQLAALPPDFQYSDFTEMGRPAELAGSKIIDQISKLALSVRNMLEKAPPCAAEPATAVRPAPDPPRSPPAVECDAEVFVLGNPTGKFDDDLEKEVEAADSEFRKRSLMPKRWADGWLKKPERRAFPVSPCSSPLFIQPLAAGEADDPFTYVKKTAERIEEAGVSGARLALWLPSGQNDPDFAAAAAKADAKSFPALRTDTPQDLAAWLCDLVRPNLAEGSMYLQIEAMGFPEDADIDVAATRLANDLQENFHKIVNREVLPNPGLWAFWGDEFGEQIRMLPGNRAIVAVHDLDTRPSADPGTVRAALEVKLTQIQEAVEQARKERKETRSLDVFFAALLAKNAKALPFSQYPGNGRFKNWHLLRFERPGPSEPLKPVPASLGVFRSNLNIWARGESAA